MSGSRFGVLLTLGCGCQASFDWDLGEAMIADDAYDMAVALVSALADPKIATFIVNGGADHDDDGDDRMTIIIERKTEAD